MLPCALFETLAAGTADGIDEIGQELQKHPDKNASALMPQKGTATA